jgi:hypothetical protein
MMNLIKVTGSTLMARCNLMQFLKIEFAVKKINTNPSQKP